MPYTRRELGKLMLTLPVAGLLPRDVFAGWQAKPNSKWAGVQVGLNVPYNYGSRDMPIDEVLAKTLELGASAVELRSQPVELSMGAPGTGQRGQDQKVAAETLRAWRLKADPSKAAAITKKWDEAGVKIDVLKYDGIYDFSDPEMDYAFKLAKALGVRAISCELDVDGSKRVGQFADKHGLMVGYHGHTKTPAMFETAFGYAKHNGANLDIGHFVAGGLGNPVEYIRQHHDRITHVHVKDRKATTGPTEGPNTPFGEGDTPIKDVLHLIRDNKWPIQATIEFEYPVPAGSDRMKEIAIRGAPRSESRRGGRVRDPDHHRRRRRELRDVVRGAALPGSGVRRARRGALQAPPASRHARLRARLGYLQGDAGLRDGRGPHLRRRRAVGLRRRRSSSAGARPSTCGTTGGCWRSCASSTRKARGSSRSATASSSSRRPA